MKKFFLILLLLWVFNGISVRAEQIGMEGIEEQLDLFDFGKVNSVSGLDFKDLILKSVRGEVDMSPSNILDSAARIVFSEIYTYNYLIKNIIIIAILSAILRNLTDSFKHKEVGELGFFITYMVLVVVLFNSVRVGIDLMTGLAASASDIMNALIPLVMSMLIMSGYVSSAAAFNSVLFFSVNFIVRIIEFFVAPIINLLAVMNVVNYLSEKSVLTSLAGQAAKGLGFFLKTIGVIFIGILSLQRISTPIINNLVLKTAKLTVNAVPVVGGVLTGAVDTVVYFTKAMRSGFMVAGVLAVIIISLVPLIKLSILVVVYKLTAAMLEPICEERLIKFINSIGKLMVLALGASFMVILMFIFYLMIVLSL